MTPPLPADRVRALTAKPKTKPKPEPEPRRRPRKFNRLANFGKSAKKVLSDAAVRDIRARHDAGEKLDSIARDHGVTMACVSMIGHRQRRAEVKP